MLEGAIVARWSASGRTSGMKQTKKLLPNLWWEFACPCFYYLIICLEIACLTGFKKSILLLFMAEILHIMRDSGALDTESLLFPLRLQMSSTAKSIFMKCVLGLRIVMQQQAGENNTANCLPPAPPM